jgi:hypothetical protein
MPPGSRAGWGLFALTMGGTPFAFPGFNPASTPPSPTNPTGYYDIVRQGDTRRRHTPNGPHKKKKSRTHSSLRSVAMSYPRPTVALAPDTDPGILPSLTAAILMTSV